MQALMCCTRYGGEWEMLAILLEYCSPFLVHGNFSNLDSCSLATRFRVIVNLPYLLSYSNNYYLTTLRSNAYHHTSSILSAAIQHALYDPSYPALHLRPIISNSQFLSFRVYRIMIFTGVSM